MTPPLAGALSQGNDRGQHAGLAGERPPRSSTQCRPGHRQDQANRVLMIFGSSDRVNCTFIEKSTFAVMRRRGPRVSIHLCHERRGELDVGRDPRCDAAWKMEVGPPESPCGGDSKPPTCCVSRRLSWRCEHERGRWVGLRDWVRRADCGAVRRDGGCPVSYTHLTLPTIYSV